MIEVFIQPDSTHERIKKIASMPCQNCFFPQNACTAVKVQLYLKKNVKKLARFWVSRQKFESYSDAKHCSKI